MRRTSKSERQITQNGEVFEIDEGIISDSQNVLVTNVTIHIVNPDDERGILMRYFHHFLEIDGFYFVLICRGTHADPIEFHVKENLSGALIGQLLYKNFTKPNMYQQRSISTMVNSSTPHRELFSAKSFRKDRQLNSKYIKNSTFIPVKKSTRKNRDTNLDTAFFVAVTPTVHFEDPLQNEESNVELSYAEPLKRKLKPKVKEVDTKKSLQYESKTTYDTRMNSNEPIKFETFATLKEVNPIQDDYIPDETESRVSTTSQLPSTITNTETPLEVIITPRPTSRIPKQTNLYVIHPNGTEASMKNESSKRSYSDFLGQGLRFVIANQQDVTDMIAITNDGTLMTVKGLDRETRDIYRLTVIAEYSKGFINGAGIYQVTVFVDDINDNPPVFNHKSFSGIIAENSPLGTEIYFNQQMIIKDADIGENANFSVTILGEGSQLFIVELVDHTAVKDLTSKAGKPDKLSKNINVEKNFANLQLLLMDNQSFLNVPHYIVRFVGPKTLDREQDSFFDLKLIARDTGGLSTEVKLGIFITDVNDNAPMFERIAIFKDSGIEVLEYTDDLEIYFVDRFERDNLNSTSIKSAVEHTNPNYGKSASNYDVTKLGDRISVGTPRQLISNNVAPVIGASINSIGTPRRIRKSKQYELPQPYFSILENISVGKNILKVTATDEDQDENAQVFYEILSETFIPQRLTARQIHFENYFGIDRLSGEIKVIRPLPAEAEIRLNISAKDIGELADYTTIKFKVIYSLCFVINISTIFLISNAKDVDPK